MRNRFEYATLIRNREKKVGSGPVDCWAFSWALLVKEMISMIKNEIYIWIIGEAPRVGVTGRDFLNAIF
ncbi:MAG: hypothetical protein BA871_09625 [Desulfuromonadales bacterium C00003096]|jgi:hypothetical protein|nr:MAG: hypothetical protein BA871_09625 [Desulfuromonadales bacterium C00003096]